MDYVARDLRRALRVGTLSGTIVTPKKNFTSISITETNILVINIRDYYATDTADNSFGSTFKTSHYPRATLNTSLSYNSNSVAVQVNAT